MIEELFEKQKNVADLLRSSTYGQRINHLKSLKRALELHTNELCEAVAADFGKPELETLLSEIYPAQKEIGEAIRNVRHWMRPTRVSTPVVIGYGTSYIRHEPKGRALIVSPWNYPIFLSLAPVVAALAAGCTVILKPSEITENSSKVLKKLLESAFERAHIAVVEGGVEVASELMTLPFNHMLFTGSTSVGKLYMQAAAKNLCSVTLELGGKSPTFVDSTADVSSTAKKIVWGKFLNVGQTCVAPDYLLVDAVLWPELKVAIKKEIEVFYPIAKKQSDLAQIVNVKNFNRLVSYIEEAKNSEVEILCGGGYSLQERKIEPFIFCFKEPLATQRKDNQEKTSHPIAELEVMRDEIFGPILPVLLYKKVEAAIDFVSQRERPLALYIFSKSKANIEKILKNTISGGVCVNETNLHLGNSKLPFGGVNHSGIGSYHGIHGFKAFTHERSVYLQSDFLSQMLSYFYPPYTPLKSKIMKLLIRYVS